MSTLTAYKPPSTVLDTSSPAATFAYRPIQLNDEDDRQFLATVTSISRWSARDAWRHYDHIGEVHYAISRSARIAGYAKFFPERVNARGQVIDEKDAGVLADIVSGIYGKFGGTRGLVERYYTLMKVCGEGYLIRVREGGVTDGYWILSPDEIESASLANGQPDLTKPIKWITASVTGQDGDKSRFTRVVEPRDFLGRIWNPSKRYVDMCDSPMTALNGLCTMLTDLTDSIQGRIRQRFALAGLLLVPSEINDANIAGPTPGEEYTNKVLNYLITLMTRNVHNHDQALAHIPGILMGPAAALEAVRHVILDTMIAETDMAVRAELINRILDGLDVQKSQVTGEGASHWADWSQSEQERRIAVQPDMESFAEALTRAILRVELLQRGWLPNAIRGWRVGVDLTEAAVKTNQAEDFRLGYDRGWISSEAGRRSIGAEETDKMGEEEYIRMVGMKMGDGYLATFGLKAKVDLDKLATAKPDPGPVAGAPQRAGKAGPGVGSPGSTNRNDRDSDSRRSETPA